MSFLSSLLPMAAGAAMTGLSGGAINPMTAGLIFGGLQTARTGNVMKGITAGLGAYGGAGLGEGLASMGSQQLGEQAGAQALNTTPQAMATQAGSEAALTTNPAVNPMGYDAFGNTPSTTMAGGYDPTTSGSFVDPARGDMYSQAYADATKSGAGNMRAGLSAAYENPGAFVDKMGGGWNTAKSVGSAATPYIVEANTPKPYETPAVDKDMGPRYRYESGVANPMPEANPEGRGQSYFPGQRYERLNAGEAKDYYGFASGGITDGFLPGESVARMASGGISSALGGYSDGGRLLKGPGDGVSDSIPAVIGKKQPARLADGEFVVPARIVSEIGNGSTEAGARKLYAMMDRVQHARGKTVGKGKVAKNTRSEKYLPA